MSASNADFELPASFGVQMTQESSVWNGEWTL